MSPRANVLVVLFGCTTAALAQDLPIGTRVGREVGAAVSTSSVPDATYDDGGRRDPFVRPAPARPVAGPRRPRRPPAGLAGLSVADVSVKGIVRGGAMSLVVLMGPRGQSFVARVNDRLQDAVVSGIDSDGVLFRTHVSGDEGGSRAGETRKRLRPVATTEDR